MVEFEDTKSFEAIVGDVTDGDRLTKAMEGVDCVIHTAGVISFGSFPDFEKMEMVNVKGAQ